ncbi:hypothetical protein MCUN1_001845 [Malassezia cuniculi]|uniref:Short/branched chain specific acyl-CoA dehydrogenase, mitochondrial n=1 Tax=Malassezia cuniculi TaxID=948313 RepID=A0AAF0EUY9_9BASI|nr:hypothetical protein MCUN1_001845 [Malassezia cuniculi]
MLTRVLRPAAVSMRAVPRVAVAAPKRAGMRSFSSSVARRDEFESPFGINSLYKVSEEEEMLREAVRRFAENEVKPKVEAMDENEKMDPEVIKGLFEQGLMAIETDPELGGAGGSFMSAIIVIEELAKVDPSVSVLCDVHNTLVNTVLRKYANDDLRKRYMPRLSEGMLGSFCLSEPSSGSDAFAMKTTVKKSEDGKHYIINGSKMWITNSAEAEFFIVFAQGDASKGYKGISAFAVTKDMGVEIAKKERKLGIRASSTCTVNFDEVKVPVENLIGEEGKGYKIAIEILNEGRVGIGAQMVGLAQGAFERGVRHTFEREQFGRQIAKFQGMQFQMAQVATEIEAARNMVYNAARLKEEGRPFTKQAAMAKLFASQVAERAAGKAIEWAGGQGFTREQGIEKYWRDSKIGAIYEGTSNIQLNTIFNLTARELGHQ